MTPEKALSQLEIFLDDAGDISVVLAADVADETIVQRLSLKQRVAKDFKASAADAVSEAASLSLRRYDAGYKPDTHEVLYLSLDEESDIRPTLQLVTRVSALEPFTEQEDVI